MQHQRRRLPPRQSAMAAALLVVGAAGLTTGSAAPAQLCVVGGTKMPGGVDAWPKNPLPDVWIKVRRARPEALYMTQGCA
eukprot:scaffold31299_cov107-Isochrysis_galbana.AAC.4